MKINENKLNRQLIGVNKWLNSNDLIDKDRKGCFNWFTGVGKTYGAILCLKSFFNLQLNDYSVTILVHNPISKKQWEKTLNENLKQKYIKYIKVYTGDYLIENDIIINCQLLIVDELDAFYSLKKIQLINGNKIRYKDNLGLTATYEDYQNRHKKIENIFPIIDKISQKEAVQNKYVSEFIEYNLGLELSEEEEKANKQYTEKIRKNISKFGKEGLNLATKCLGGGKHHSGTFYDNNAWCKGWAIHNGWYQGIENRNDASSQQINALWNPKKIFFYAIELMRNIKKRKELLYNNSAKLETSVNLLKKFKDIKTIIFSQSTKFADSLYVVIEQKQPDNSVIYHSNIKSQIYPSHKTGKLIKHGKKRLKDRCIRRLEKGLSKHLITSSVLDKGVNIPSLKIGITTSGTQNPTQYEQRKGRPIRVDPLDKEGVAILINLYIKNSKDETWLINRQENIEHEVHYINNINEINLKKYLTNEIKMTDL